jgi:hypothetical protein
MQNDSLRLQPTECALVIGDLADVLISTMEDARDAFQITGSPDAVVRELQEYRTSRVIVTAGAGGAFWLDGDQARSAASYQAEALDRTGAGDAFAAGLLLGVLEGDVGGGVDRGLAMAALKLGIYGDQLTDRPEEVERLIMGHRREVTRRKYPPVQSRECAGPAFAKSWISPHRVRTCSTSTPTHIIEAAAQAVADGFTKYTAKRGIPSVRETLATKIATQNGFEVDIDQLIVTTGAVTALLHSLMVLCDPGDVVLLPNLAWPNYEMMATVIDAPVSRYPLDPARGYLPDLDAPDRICRDTPLAKALVINSPGNPTGEFSTGRM